MARKIRDDLRGVVYIGVDGAFLKAGDNVPDDLELGDHLFDEPEGSYSGMRVADLQAEIEKRNEGREDDAKVSDAGKKADLIAALEADDAAQGPAQN